MLARRLAGSARPPAGGRPSGPPNRQQRHRVGSTLVQLRRPRKHARLRTRARARAGQPRWHRVSRDDVPPRGRPRGRPASMGEERPGPSLPRPSSPPRHLSGPRLGSRRGTDGDLLRPTSDFDDNAAGVGDLPRAGEILRGRHGGRPEYAEKARMELEKQLKETPDDLSCTPSRGLALAYLGRKDEAIREGELGLKPGRAGDRRGQRTLLSSSARPDRDRWWASTRRPSAISRRS